MGYSKTIMPGSKECYHLYILVGLRTDYSKPARSESCDWRGRPCFTQIFWSKTIQLQETFAVSFWLPSSQFGLSPSLPGNKGRPGEVDSKNKVRLPKELNSHYSEVWSVNAFECCWVSLIVTVFVLYGVLALVRKDTWEWCALQQNMPVVLPCSIHSRDNGHHKRTLLLYFP